ncbi:class I SAM-dependent methyltransferase [Cohnella laeviribosi]|uniref:class I SAM-dependent methyltransferase n=1 Tax=Cohnella laeviribosi TaxID=380174 RepID=UPI000376D680|nr:class I SAM-dependent methyltransferase [Cohnella laeviribosi]
MTERRFKPEHMKKLDNPERRKLLPPHKLLELLEIQDNDILIDLGAGTGYFTIPAASLTRNKVYALDVEPQMLQYLGKRVEEQKLDNVELIEGAIEHIPLAGQIADHVIASFVLHEVEPLEKGLQEMSRVLKPGGKVLCIEWEKKQTVQGPPLHHRIQSNELAKAFDENGLLVEKLTYPSDQHYLIVARKTT